MTKYIDTEAVFDVLTEVLDTEGEAKRAIHKAWERIKALPAADVAEVVRCKDCERAYFDLGGWCCSYGPCVDCTVEPDFYCKFGEAVRGVTNA